MRFNSPPSWPPAPPGWTPWEGWAPDPAWGPAPEGWQFWVDDSMPATPAPPAPVFETPPAPEPVEAPPAPVFETPQPPEPVEAPPVPVQPAPAPVFEAPPATEPVEIPPAPVFEAPPATEPVEIPPAPVFETPPAPVFEAPPAPVEPAPSWAPVAAPQPAMSPPAPPPPASAQPPVPPQPGGQPPFVLAPLPTTGPAATRADGAGRSGSKGGLRTILEVVGALVLLGAGIGIGYVAKGNPKPVQLAAPPPIVKISLVPTPVPTTVYVGSTADPMGTTPAQAPPNAAPMTDMGVTLDSITLGADAAGHEQANVKLTNNGGHTFDINYEVTVTGPDGTVLATLDDVVLNVAGGKSVTSQMSSDDPVVTQLSTISFKVEDKLQD